MVQPAGIRGSRRFELHHHYPGIQSLIPAVFVLTLLSLGSRGDRIRDLKIKDWASRLVLPLALWGGISLLTIFIVWPAMWVKPMDTLLNIMRYTLSAADGEIGGAQFVEAYEAAGEDSSSYAYFYPLTYLWRTTPIILAGLVLAGVTLIVPKTPADLGVGVRRNLLLLLVYVGQRVTAYLCRLPLCRKLEMGQLREVPSLKNQRPTPMEKAQ